MQERRPGSVIHVEPRESVTLQMPDGSQVIVQAAYPERFTSREQRKRIRVARAIQALIPITRRVLYPGESGVDQDGYFEELSDLMPEEYAQLGDPEEVKRLACARLGSDGYSSLKVAGIIMRNDPRRQAAIQLGSMSKENREMQKQRLATELKLNYPANKTKNGLRPKRRKDDSSQF